MSEKERNRSEEEAAHGDEGQDQEPVQSDEKKSQSVFDTDEHSDAPGPFGTGDE